VHRERFNVAEREMQCLVEAPLLTNTVCSGYVESWSILIYTHSTRPPMIRIGEYSSESEADVVVAQLRASGIPAVRSSNDSALLPGIRGASVWVPSDAAALAVDVLMASEGSDQPSKAGLDRASVGEGGEVRRTENQFGTYRSVFLVGNLIVAVLAFGFLVADKMVHLTLMMVSWLVIGMALMTKLKDLRCPACANRLIRSPFFDYAIVLGGRCRHCRADLG
jgi:hypothetical protein